jgi:hypothetical protein
MYVYVTYIISGRVSCILADKLTFISSTQTLSLSLSLYVANQENGAD